MSAFNQQSSIHSGQPPGQQLAEETMCEDKAVLARLGKIGIVFMISLVPEIVFVFHSNSALKSGLQQNGNKLRPVE